MGLLGRFADFVSRGSQFLDDEILAYNSAMSNCSPESSGTGEDMLDLDAADEPDISEDEEDVCDAPPPG